MKKRLIIVPKDKKAEQALDTNEAVRDQLIELTIDEKDFIFIFKMGIIDLINKEENTNVDDWELWQQSTNGTIETERETLSISDDQKSFLQLETLTIDSGNTFSIPTTNWRYQYDNHLGSACLELDDSANVISYEEYYPFGSTSYRSGKSSAEVSLKRYRYCGKVSDAAEC